MKKISIFLINFYQKHISKIFHKMGINCKYYPTCSHYTKEAIKKYGFFKGSIKGMYRIIRCNPFSKGGYDPLK